MKRGLLILGLVSWCGFSRAAAKSISSDQADGTAKRAMAILRANCLTCHSDEKKKGGLRLTSLENARKGGETGPAVVPGKVSASLLAKVILPDSDPHMPPKKQLAERDIDSLRRWIAQGAKWDVRALLDNPTDNKPVQLGAMPPNYQPVLALALSPDGRQLAVARANRVFIHDLSQTNRPIVAELPGHLDVVQSLAWSTNGQMLASGSFRKIIFWNPVAANASSPTNSPAQREITNSLVGRITALQFSPGGETLAAADGVPTRSGLVHLFSAADGKLAATLSAHQDSIYTLQISPDGKRLATAGADKVIKL